jgi:hypothetical protein
MRVLVIPLLGMKDMREDSSGQMWANILLNMYKLADGKIWFYVLLPRGHDGYELFERLPNTTVILEERARKGYFVESDVVDYGTLVPLFNQKEGVYPIDVVLTSKIGAALNIARALRDIRYESGVPIVLLEDRAWSRKETHQLVDKHEFMIRSAAYSFFKTVVLTNLEREEIIDVAQLYLSPAQLKQLKENVIVKPLGVNVKEIEEIVKNVKKFERFTCFWGGRISAQKRVPFVLKQYLWLFESGRDIDILITSSHPCIPPKMGDEIKELLKRYRGLRIEFSVPKRRFLEYCAASHVWLSASLHEGYTVGHVEMGCTGVPGIVPRRPWSEELFGKNYKLMYDPGSAPQAAALLRWVYDNYDEAVAIGRETSTRMRELNQDMAFADKLLSIMSGEVEARNEEKLAVGKAMEEAFEATCSRLGDEFSLFTFFSALRDVLFDKSFNRLSKPSVWDARRWLLENGYIEVYCSPEPVFRRADK